MPGFDNPDLPSDLTGLVYVTALLRITCFRLGGMGRDYVSILIYRLVEGILTQIQGVRLHQGSKKMAAYQRLFRDEIGQVVH
jgi:hypothetical protein